MRLLLAGGGTGGHLFPAVALAETLKSQEPTSDILFVGTKNGIEFRLLPELGWPLETVNISGLIGKGVMAKLRVLPQLLQSVMQGCKILKRFRPDVVVGVGGYASAPLVIAARMLGLPTLLHEQNAIPGLTNRLLARWVDRVCTSFEETQDAFAGVRAIVTGNPLRSGMADCPTADGDTTTLLVFGGSRGARAINAAVCQALPQLLQANPELRIIHQTGTEDLQTVQEAYAAVGCSNTRIEAFINGMAEVYRDADLVVCRAGATTVAELTACGRAAVMIPYPHAAGDHQKANAQALVDQQAAIMLEQSDLTGESLAATVNELLADRATLRAMARAAKEQGRTDAAERIIDLCREMITRKGTA